MSTQPLGEVTIDPPTLNGISSSVSGLFFDADALNSSVLVRTANLPSVYIDKYQNVCVNSTIPASQFNINAATGTCLQLTYNDTSNKANFNVTATGDLTVGASGGDVEILSGTNLNLKNHNGSTSGLYLNDVLVIATAAQLNYTTATPGTAAASKALVLDGSSDVAGINSLSATSLTGTLATAAQTNITSVGSLTGLTTAALTLGATAITATGAEINYLDITTIGTAEASKALVLDASSNITGINSLTATSITVGSTALNATHLSYLDVTPGTAAASKALVLDASSNIATINSLTATSITGTLATAAQTNITSVGSLTGLTTAGLTLGATAITATGTQLNYTAVTTAGTAEASKALVLDASSNITGINSLTATALVVGSTSINATHLGYINVTPGTAAASKALVLDASSDITGINSLTATSITVGSTALNATHLGYLDVTPGTAAVSKALVLDASGNIATINSLTATTLIAGSTTINETHLAYLDVTPGSGTASKALILNAGGDISGIDNLTATSINATNDLSLLKSGLGASGSAYIYVGKSTSTYNAGSLSYSHVSDGSVDNHVRLGLFPDKFVLKAYGDGDVDISFHNGSVGLKLGGVLVTSTAAQLNYTAVTTAGTAEASKALVLDSSSNITGINSLTATALVVGSTSINATHLGYINVTPGTAEASKALVLDASANIATINSLTATSITVGSTALNESQLGYLNVTPGTAAVSKALVLDASGDIATINSLTATTLIAGSTTINETHLAYLDVTPGTAQASKALILNAGSDISGIDNLTATSIDATNDLTLKKSGLGASGSATIYVGKSSSSYNLGSLSYSHVSDGSVDNHVRLGLFPDKFVLKAYGDGDVDISFHNGTVGLKLGGVLVTSTAAQLNYTTVTTAGTAEASKALVLDASSNITGINSLTATALVVGSTSINATQLGYLNVTPGTAEASKALVLDASSNITGINSLTATALVVGSTSINATQLGYLDVTPGTAAVSKALVLDASGNIATINSLTATTLIAGSTTINETHLGYLNVTPGSGTASKAVILNATGDVSGIGNISCDQLTASENINLIRSATNPSIIVGRGWGTNNYGSLGFTQVEAGSTSNYLQLLISPDKVLLKAVATGDVDIPYHNGSVGLQLGGVLVTSTAAQLNYTTVTTAGTAEASKALVLDASSNITGINSLTATTLVVGSTSINATQLGYIDVTPGTAAASKALVLDASANIATINSLTATTLIAGSTTINETHLGYLDVTPGTAAVSKALVLDGSGAIATITSLTATSITGTLQTAAQTNITSVGSLTGLTTAGLTLGATAITATGVELNYVDVETIGTAEASKALVVDSSKDITGINVLSSTKINVGSASNSTLPLELGVVAFTFTGAYAYSNSVNAHGVVGAGDGVSANYSLRADGRILVTGEVEVTSDKRLKKDIVNLDDNFCKQFIMNTQPIQFNWIDETKDKKREYGYVAQEVYKSGYTDLVSITQDEKMEELVDPDGFINPKGAKFTIATGKIIPIVANNQKNIFEDLKQKNKQIQELQDNIMTMNTKLEILDAMIHNRD